MYLAVPMLLLPSSLASSLHCSFNLFVRDEIDNFVADYNSTPYLRQLYFICSKLARIELRSPVTYPAWFALVVLFFHLSYFLLSITGLPAEGPAKRTQGKYRVKSGRFRLSYKRLQKCKGQQFVASRMKCNDKKPKPKLQRVRT